MVKISKVARFASMSRKTVRAAAVVAVVAVVAAAAVSAVGMTAVVIGAVAAEVGGVELVAAVVESHAGPDSHPANSNAPQPRARGTNSDVTEPARSPARAAPAIEIPSELVTLANEIGAAWSRTYVAALQAEERDIVGAWPGTIREARRQLLARVKTRLEPEQLDQLARITNLAARRGWETVSEPDLES